MSFNGGSYDVE